MSEPNIIPIRTVAHTLATWANAAATAGKRANDPDAIARYAALQEQYASMVASIQAHMAAAPAPARQAAPRAAGAVPLRRPARRPTFTGFDDFMPALSAAKERAARMHGERWYLVEGATEICTVPRSWVSLPRSGWMHWAGRRDQRIPAARFWEGGVLPSGPLYYEDMVRATGDREWGNGTAHKDYASWKAAWLAENAPAELADAAD